MSNSYIRCFAFSLLTLSSVGCAASSTPPDKIASRPGYYLPATAFDIEVSTTYEQRKVAFYKTQDDTNEWDVGSCDGKWLTASNMTISPTTIADQSHFYELDPSSDFFNELQYTVEYTEDGRLKGINSTSTGKVSSFVSSVGSFVGRVLPFFSGILTGTSKGEGIQEASKGVGLQEACENKQLAEVNARLWFEEISNTGPIVAELTNIKQAISATRNSRRDVLAAIDGQHSKTNEAKKRLEYAEILSTVISIQEKEFMRLTSLKQAQFANFKQERGIKTVSDTKTSQKRFTISELLDIGSLTIDTVNPEQKPETSLQTPNTGSVMDLTMCTNPLDSLETLWNCTATVPRLIPTTKFEVKPALTSDEVNTYSSKKALTIVSRRPHSMLLEVIEYSADPDIDGGAGEYATRVKSQAPVNVLVPNSEGVLHVLKKNAWREQKLALNFFDNGTISKIEATQGGGADAFAKSLDEAVKGGLKSYQETLTSLSEIKTKKAELAMAGDKAKLAYLQTQKQILDQQIANNGVITTEEQLLAKAKLDAKIELLKQQKVLDELETEPTPPAPPTEAEILTRQAEILELKIKIAELLKKLEDKG